MCIHKLISQSNPHEIQLVIYGDVNRQLINFIWVYLMYQSYKIYLIKTSAMFNALMVIIRSAHSVSNLKYGGQIPP